MGILTNSVSLLGKVGKYKECKCFETGGMVTTINFGVKTGGKWNNFFIDFFNTKTRELATEVGDNIKEGDYLSAYKESIKNAKKYEEKSSSIMYCYFNHTELDSLEWNMYQMAEFVKFNQMGDYYALKSATKKQLQSIKEEELFEIQNIL